MYPPQQPSVPQVPYNPTPNGKGKKQPSVTIKLLVIAALIVMLAIPWAFLEWLIYSRERSSEEATIEVSQKWSNGQNIRGPVLIVPVMYSGNALPGIKILPENLKIEGQVMPEKRYRGIYEVVVYNTKLHVSGTMRIPDFIQMQVDTSRLEWNKSYISVGIGDMRGIKESIQVKWGDSTYAFNPGMGFNDQSYMENAGVSTMVWLPKKEKSAGIEIPFSFDLNLAGSKSLYFEPLGKTTNVHLTSTWEAPSFAGAFLPDSRTVNAAGFTADWKVLHLNRSYPQVWVNNTYSTEASQFGVDLVVPVDHYTKAGRSSKYAILLIGLTFLVYFFVEVLNKMRVHPFQYILVGLSIVLFYVLLLSFSEHMRFNLAYWLAGGATIAAITIYSGALFRKRIPTAIIGTVLVMLYGFMFVIIQLEDYALLVGSIALFIILIVLMYLSRKINWYGDEENPSSNT